MTAYLGQVADHGLREAWVTLAGGHRAQLQAQEGAGWQALQGLGQGGGTQAVVGQGQCLQALGAYTKGQNLCQPRVPPPPALPHSPGPRTLVTLGKPSSSLRFGVQGNWGGSGPVSPSGEGAELDS